MRLVSLVLASIVGASTLAAQVSAVSKRPQLTGFGPIRFGITESELKDALPVVKSEMYITDAETAWYESPEPVEVDGAPFHLSFMIERGIVRRISATRGAPAPNGSCKAEFDAMVGYLASQYGPPDTAFQRGTREFYKADFEFEDHAYIELLTGFFEKHGTCVDTVMYYSSSAVAN